MINAAEAYTYDGQNNLTSLWGSQYSTSTYTYDANGDRLTKLNQTHTTQYYYYDTNLLFTKRNNSIDVRYLYDEDTLYAAIAADGLPYWYNVDLRGSVTNIIKGDTTGSITTSLNKSYVYDAYGNTSVTSTSEFRNAVAYTGAIYDEETGLYYLMSRYYDPEIAQFISEDSYRGDGEHFWNLYMYCEGDPINRTDRNGNYFVERSALAAAGYAYLQSKHYYFAAALYHHAFYGGGKEPKFIGKYGKKFSQNGIVLNAVYQKIKNYKGTKIVGYGLSTSVNFTSGDLHYAVGKMGIMISGQKNKKVWNLRVKVHDRYNFDEIRTMKNGVTKSNLANDLGYLLQHTGMIKTFKWSYEFSLKIVL